MSNNTSIKVRKISYRDDPRNTISDIFLENSYDNESIFCTNIPNTPKELFLYVYKHCTKKNIIESVFKYPKKSIDIDGVEFSAQQLQQWLKYAEHSFYINGVRHYSRSR